MEEQTIRFTRERGRRIAWTRSGEGPSLIMAGSWMCHLEVDWGEPRFRSFIEALGRHRTVVRYDPPGSGASADGELPSRSLEDEVAAFAAVAEAADAVPADLFAGSSGVPIGIAYAAAYPERVRRLVLYGGYASGSEIADSRTRTEIVRLVREHWGLGSRILADMFMPSADRSEREAFVEHQRRVASADGAAEALESVYGFDVAGDLDRTEVPSVVLHRREDRAIPFELGRELAARLPEARFLALDGADHYPWYGDSAQILRAALHALGVEEAAESLAPEEPGAESAGIETLTERETEVLTLVAAGLSDREIAERLVLSPHTVHRHVANLRTKLGLPTRAAVVAAAARRGLI